MTTEIKLSFLADEIVGEAFTITEQVVRIQDQDKVFAGSFNGSDYSEFQVTKGYGKLTKAGVRLNKGVSGKVSIRVEVNTVDENKFKEFKDTITKTLTQNEEKQLQEMEKKYGKRTGWLWGFFGVSSGYEAEHYKNERNITVKVESEEQKKAVQELFSSEQKKTEVKGEFDVIGQSPYPTVVELFVEMLVITTESGQKLTILADEAIAADSSGDTSKAGIKGSPVLELAQL